MPRDQARREGMEQKLSEQLIIIQGYDVTGIRVISSKGLFINYLIESYQQHFSFNNSQFGPGLHIFSF